MENSSEDEEIETIIDIQNLIGHFKSSDIFSEAKIAAFVTKLADVKDLVSENSKDINGTIETISKQLIEIESPSLFVEIVESARSCIGVADSPNFWKQVINVFLLKF